MELKISFKYYFFDNFGQDSGRPLLIIFFSLKLFLVLPPTKISTTMTEDRLHHLMTISIDHKIAKKISYEEIFKKFRAIEVRSPLF